jgi:hypothetical protein
MIPVMINDVKVECINQAAILYKVPVPVAVILSVMKKENGRNGQAVKNKKNGTYDYGVFQINSIWLPKIAAYGYTREDIQYNACKNTQVAVWIIGKNMAEGRAVWSSIANYHSHTPTYNKRYRESIYANYQHLTNVMTANSI